MILTKQQRERQDSLYREYNNGFYNVVMGFAAMLIFIGIGIIIGYFIHECK